MLRQQAVEQGDRPAARHCAPAPGRVRRARIRGSRHTPCPACRRRPAPAPARYVGPRPNTRTNTSAHTSSGMPRSTEHAARCRVQRVRVQRCWPSRPTAPPARKANASPGGNRQRFQGARASRAREVGPISARRNWRRNPPSTRRFPGASRAARSKPDACNSGHSSTTPAARCPAARVRPSRRCGRGASTA